MGVPGIADVAGSEANVRIEKAQGVNDGGRKNLRVRVNLPFCPNTCQYCAMPSDYATAMLMPDYCKALEREVELSGRDMADYEVTSVYLGGGIATYIKAERLCSIVDALRASFALAPDVEITMRALLGYVDEFKLRDCQKAGISKIDVDYHFWDPHAVRFTGRQALPEQSMATVRGSAHEPWICRCERPRAVLWDPRSGSQEHWVAELGARSWI